MGFYSILTNKSMAFRESEKSDKLDLESRSLVQFTRTRYSQNRTRIPCPTFFEITKPKELR